MFFNKHFELLFQISFSFTTVSLFTAMNKHRHYSILPCDSFFSSQSPLLPTDVPQYTADGSLPALPGHGSPRARRPCPFRHSAQFPYLYSYRPDTDTLPVLYPVPGKWRTPRLEPVFRRSRLLAAHHIKISFPKECLNIHNCLLMRLVRKDSHMYTHLF